MKQEKPDGKSNFLPLPPGSLYEFEGLVVQALLTTKAKLACR